MSAQKWTRQRIGGYTTAGYTIIPTGGTANHPRRWMMLAMDSERMTSERIGGPIGYRTLAEAKAAAQEHHDGADACAS